MNRISRAAVVVTTAVLSGVLLLSGQAAATGKASAWSQRGEAARVNYWSSTDDFRVSDTLCDGHAVYAQYQRAGAGVQRLNNRNGCGTYVDFNRSFTNGQTIKYRACVDISALPDNCGPWKWDTTG